MREYIATLAGRLVGNHRATIEPFEPAVSPRRPIDLTDDAAVAEVLDLAIKVGAELLDSGTGAINTQPRCSSWRACTASRTVKWTSRTTPSGSSVPGAAHRCRP